MEWERGELKEWIQIQNKSISWLVPLFLVFISFSLSIWSDFVLISESFFSILFYSIILRIYYSISATNLADNSLSSAFKFEPNHEPQVNQDINEKYILNLTTEF